MKEADVYNTILTDIRKIISRIRETQTVIRITSTNLYTFVEK